MFGLPGDLYVFNSHESYQMDNQYVNSCIIANKCSN